MRALPLLMDRLAASMVTLGRLSNTIANTPMGTRIWPTRMPLGCWRMPIISPMMSGMVASCSQPVATVSMTLGVSLSRSSMGPDRPLRPPRSRSRALAAAARACRRAAAPPAGAGRPRAWPWLARLPWRSRPRGLLRRGPGSGSAMFRGVPWRFSHAPRRPRHRVMAADAGLRRRWRSRRPSAFSSMIRPRGARVLQQRGQRLQPQARSTRSEQPLALAPDCAARASATGIGRPWPARPCAGRGCLRSRRSAPAPRPLAFRLQAVEHAQKRAPSGRPARPRTTGRRRSARRPARPIRPVSNDTPLWGAAGRASGSPGAPPAGCPPPGRRRTAACAGPRPPLRHARALGRRALRHPRRQCGALHGAICHRGALQRTGTRRCCGWPCPGAAAAPAAATNRCPRGARPVAAARRCRPCRFAGRYAQFHDLPLGEQAHEPPAASTSLQSKCAPATRVLRSPKPWARAVARMASAACASSGSSPLGT